jgi:predicted nucleic acid-binding protein
MVTNGRITPLYCTEIIAEYVRSLRKPKFVLKIPESMISEAISTFRLFGETVEPVKSDFHMEDESDRVFYDAAVTTGVILITGNLKHFPPKEFIMSPADFLKMMHETEESFGAID